MNYTAQIAAEGHLLNRPQKSGKKPKRPLSRSKRVRVASSKRIIEGFKYRKQRIKFLTEHPWCGLGGIRTDTWKMEPCGQLASDIHHRAGRLNGNYLDETTWLPLCRNCHNELHRHPKEARALGLLK